MSLGELHSPLGSKISNPLKNGKRVEKLKKQHAKRMSEIGFKEPKSPLK